MVYLRRICRLITITELLEQIRRTTMKIYEYNESTQTLNTECGLFHIGDTVQLTEIDSQTPVKTVLYGARIDSTEYVILFFDEKCGMPLYLSEHEIDDMCRVSKS